MNEDGIVDGKYIETTDNTLCDLKRSQKFLFIIIFINKDYEVMLPSFNQPGCFFLLLLKLISLNIVKTFLKFCPIIDQTGSHIYNASKLFAKYLSPLQCLKSCCKIR